MKRLALLCWLLAWTAWLLLGLGLHHQLPRKLGPPVCQIPLAPYSTHSMYVVGFDGPSRVVVAELPETSPKFIALYDAETGSAVARYPAPDLEWRFSWRDCTLRHGFLIANERDKGGLKAVDLSDGSSHTISPRGVSRFAVHPTEPLVAFVGSIKGSPGRRLALYNLKEYRSVFDSEILSDGRRYDTPIILPGTDKFLVMGSSPDGYFFPAAGTPIVACTIPASGGKPIVEPFKVGPPERGWATTSHTGRAVFGAADSGAFEVFDFNLNRVVFSRPSTPPGSALSPVGATQNPPALSADGRTVMGDWPQTLWDIDAGKPLWRASYHDFVFPDLRRAARPSVGTRFFVLEEWSQIWKRWLPNFRYATWACRHMRDGSLIYRIPMNSGDGSYNADWSLVIGDDGAVYRLPPSTDWPLLILCQTILATPLILLWIALLSLGRRAARRQSAPPTQVST